MPVIHTSPSVNVIERDASGYTIPPSKTTLLLIGEASKGPIGVPTEVSSTDDLKTKFGKKLNNAFLNHAASNYLNQSSSLIIIRSAYDEDITFLGTVKGNGTYTISASNNKMKIALDGAVTGKTITIGSVTGGTPALTASKINVALTASGLTSLEAVATDSKYINLVADETVKKVELQTISNDIYDLFGWATTDKTLERAWYATCILTSTDAPDITSANLSANSFSIITAASSLKVQENSKDPVIYTIAAITGADAGSTVASRLAYQLEAQRDTSETHYRFSAIDAKLVLVGSSLETASVKIFSSNIAGGAYSKLAGDWSLNSPATAIFSQTVNNVGKVYGTTKGTAFNNMEVVYSINSFNENTLSVYDSSSTSPIETLSGWNFSEADPDNYIENYVENNSDYIKVDWWSDAIDRLDKLTFTMTGGQNGINDSNTTQRVRQLEGEIANAELWYFNLVSIPGEYSTTGISAILNFCENVRGDCMGIIDTPFGLDADEIVAWHNGEAGSGNSVKFNSSYGAIYWPWVLGNNTDTGLNIWFPPAVYMPALYAKSDNQFDPWFPPAGADRGILPGIYLDTETSPDIGKRDIMYGKPLNNVNPIVTFKSIGTVVWGQKTLLRKLSALDRVNVRRMVLYVEKGIVDIATPLLFKLNVPSVWQDFTDKSNAFLSDVQIRYGLQDFLVVCDATTNTNDIIDQNKMVGKIFLKPVKSIEVIDLYFTITSSGGSFTE
jgi:hypothetical protein